MTNTQRKMGRSNYTLYTQIPLSPFVLEREMFRDWENYYLLVGSAAGALIGLMFAEKTGRSNYLFQTYNSSVPFSDRVRFSSSCAFTSAHQSCR